MSNYTTCYSNEFNPGWKQIFMTESNIVIYIYFIHSNSINKSLAQMVECSLYI